MRTVWLALASFILPLIWGWFVHRLLVRVWPDKPFPVDAGNAAVPPSETLADYQI